MPNIISLTQKIAPAMKVLFFKSPNCVQILIIKYFYIWNTKQTFSSGIKNTEAVVSVLVGPSLYPNKHKPSTQRLLDIQSIIDKERDRAGALQRSLT